MPPQESAATRPGSIEQPKTPEQQNRVETQLARLRETINQGQMDKTVDMLIGASVEQGEISQATVDRFVQSLTDAERGRLVAFLEGKDIDPKKAALRSRLDALRQDVTPGQPQVLEQITSTAGGIARAIDMGIERLGVTGKINDFAKRISERTGIPIPVDARKVIETVRSFAMDFVAGKIENIAASLKNSNILTTSRDLRMLQIKPEHREAFKLAYDAWAKTRSGTPPSIEDAEKYKLAVDQWKKAPGSKPQPTLAEALSGQPATQVAATQPAAAPTQAAAPAPEKVEGKKDVTLADGSTASVTFGADKKVIVEVAGLKREMKAGTDAVTEVTVTKPQGADKGSVTLKAGMRTLKVDLVALRDSVRDKKADVMTGDNSTKISLIETA